MQNSPQQLPIEVNIKFALDEKEAEIEIKNSPAELDSYLFPAFLRVIYRARDKAKEPLY